MFISATELANRIVFKDPLDEADIGKINARLYLILMDIVGFTLKNFGKEIVVTDLISTLEEDIDLQRDSDAHRTKRGADLRSSIYTEAEKSILMDRFNRKYSRVASISRSDLKPRLMVLHGKGANQHFHVALHYKYGDR